MAAQGKRFSIVVLGIAALLLAACAPQTPQVGSSAQKSGWSDVVAAANKEGKVVVVGSGSEEQRRALTDTFKQKYPQIDVEYQLMAPSAPTPKLLGEHAANKVETDVVIIGVAGNMPLIDAGALADVHPFLLGPDLDEA